MRLTSIRVLCAVAGMAFLVAFNVPAQAGPIGNAANWLITQQVSDGSFPWTPGGLVYNNTQGATALGLVGAYGITGNLAHLQAAEGNAAYIMSPAFGHFTTNHEVHFSTADPMFLEMLSATTGNATYANFVQTNFWDKLTAGTYGASNNLNAAGFGAAVLAGRTGQHIVELTPWDLSKTAIAAHIAGKAAAQTAFMGSILDALNVTTTTPTPPSFDLSGLSGAIWASAVTGIDLDPTTGRWASANSTADLATMLDNFIASNGGFVYNTTATISDDSNADSQVTAFAILGLAALDPALYRTQVAGGRAFLLGLQQGSGEIIGYPGADPNGAGSVEVHGEALYALAATTVPEPGTLPLFVSGLIGLLVILRRRGTATAARA